MILGDWNWCFLGYAKRLFSYQIPMLIEVEPERIGDTIIRFAYTAMKNMRAKGWIQLSVVMYV
ncbi:hypothetical protein SD10_12735 [Spirosoma radiotolerans]|uniref:Uncharacterized protein n=1 Tax=Spirosoma radiotolerans TaxID=1379870 RepID=A0A0E3ZV74_9BACT|nr:hypothetical protein SD10_12735 [Spirosoma radiotolerans]